MFKSRLGRIEACPVLKELTLLVPAEEAGGEEGGNCCECFLERGFGLLMMISEHRTSRRAAEMVFLLLIYAPKC